MLLYNMASTKDQILDNLYSNYFTALLTVRHNPTFVQKNVMDETVSVIQKYILSFTKDIRADVEAYEERKTTSSLVWDKDYYHTISTEKYEMLDDFEERVNNTRTDRFLEEDFSFISEELEALYPGRMPKSIMREIYLENWKTIQKE